MKLNNKGFAISSIMYIILVLAVLLISLTLVLLSSRKIILDKLKKEATNEVYEVYPLTYRQTLNTLKEEAITYASDNNIEKDSIKISNLDSSVDSETLSGYKLDSKYLTMVSNSDTYDVYLGESQTTTSLNTNDMIDILDYKISGNSYQQTYSGKNLFDISKVISNENVVNNGNGTLSVTPLSSSAGVSAESPATLKDYAPSLEVGKTYILSAETTGDNKYIYLGASEFEWYFGKTRKITQADLDSNVNWYATGTDTTFTAVISKIQIEEGSTKTEYEPYVGEMASPNPKYPQEIQGVGDLVTDSEDPNYGKYKIPITVKGKNLLDNKTFLIKQDSYADWEVTDTGIKQSKKLNKPTSGYTPKTLFDITNLVEPNKTYYFHRDFENNYETINSNHGLISGRLQVYVDGKATLTINSNKTDGSVTMPESFTTVDIRTYSVPQLDKLVDPVDNVIYYFEWKNLYMSEEPYSGEFKYGKTPTTTNIYLDQPLRKIDGSVDSLTFRNKNISREVGYYKFNGNETIELVSNYFSITVPEMSSRLGLSNRLISTTNGGVIGNNAMVFNNSTLRAYVLNLYPNIQKFKEWLSNNYVYIVHTLPTPINETVELPKINIDYENDKITIGTTLQPSSMEFIIIKKIKQL